MIGWVGRSPKSTAAKTCNKSDAGNGSASPALASGRTSGRPRGPRCSAATPRRRRAPDRTPTPMGNGPSGLSAYPAPPPAGTGAVPLGPRRCGPARARKPPVLTYRKEVAARRSPNPTVDPASPRSAQPPRHTGSARHSIPPWRARSKVPLKSPKRCAIHLPTRSQASEVCL